jgi:hypothetical protein
MATFVNLSLLSLNTRLKEIDLILEEAQKISVTNQDLYNALCRSAQVLLSAHFEGYLKELVKSSLNDINHFSNFKSASFDLKKRFCEHFISPNKDEKNSKRHHQKITELIEVLENLDTKFKKEHFSYDENSNPKASVLDKIAGQFGIENFFKKLKKSNLDIVFSNTNADNIALCERIKNQLLQSTEEYPYKLEKSFLEIDEDKPDSDDFWTVFLSDLLKRRHDIAHGREIENSVGHEIIESDKTKIEILAYIFTTFNCEKTNPFVLIEKTT